MIINSFCSDFNSSASGSGIKLLLGNELPEVVELNAFYAIPKVEVTKSYFSENEPSLQEGVIWIRTCSTDAVEIIFTSDSEPQLVYGIVEAQQYYNDAWHTIDFYIGKEENWEKISSFVISVSYTGDMVESEITDGENIYRLFTITNSGTLTISDTTPGDVWICGGGSSGITAGGGGGGAYAATLMTERLFGTYAITVGTGNGGATSFGDLATANGVANNMNGGTGGGSGNGRTTVGTGDGVSKYPFGDSTLFECHCAGGGGGGYSWRDSAGQSSIKRGGGTGGTNGGNGKADGVYESPTSENTRANGGTGGTYGGGSGGYGAWSNSSASAGTAATFYGSGGGGGGHGEMYTNNKQAGGAGYQGVCYIRIKK